MTKSTEALEMKMFAALGKHQREYGEAANDALLNRFGVSRAIDISPGDFERVIGACSAADDDEASGRSKPDRERRTEAKGRTPSAFESVVNNAPTLKGGFDLAAKAIHARRPK